MGALGLFGRRPGGPDRLTSLHPDLLRCIASNLDDRECAVAAVASPRVAEFRRDADFKGLRNFLWLVVTSCRAESAEDVEDALDRMNFPPDTATVSVDQYPGEHGGQVLPASTVQYAWHGVLDRTAGTEKSYGYPGTPRFLGPGHTTALAFKQVEIHAGTRKFVIGAWRSSNLVVMIKYRSMGSMVTHVKQLYEDEEQAVRLVRILGDVVPFSLTSLRWKGSSAAASRRVVAALEERFGDSVHVDATYVLSRHPYLF